jgi:predicted nuclease with TOPRIM domain
MKSLVVPSAIENSTQTNRDTRNFKKSNLAFLSKAELRKAYEFLEMENYQLKQEKESEIGERIKIREALKESNKGVIYYQKRYQELLDKSEEERISNCLHISFIKSAG